MDSHDWDADVARSATRLLRRESNSSSSRSLQLQNAFRLAVALAPAIARRDGERVKPEARAAVRSARGQGRRTGARRAHLRVILLGRFAVIEDGVETRIPSAGARIVAVAALHPSPLTRTRIASLLWPHLRERQAAATLRTARSRLRAACPSLVEDDPPALRLAPDVTVDAWELEALAVRAAEHGDADIELPLESLTAELLPGWDEEWVLYERDRLRELCLHALESNAGRLARKRRFARAISTAYVAIELDPLRESAARTLAEIHLAEGNRAQAALCYLAYRQRLMSALRMEPSEEMQALIAPLITETPRR